jgi:phosphoglycolate phosphatase
MTRTLVLDLDGTLVDSLPDLAAGCNRFMAKLGLASFAAAEIRPMIGDGAAALLRRAMAARDRTAGPADIDAFLTDYAAHAADNTVPYAGVPETLDRLVAAGWRLAVCTNKPGIPARAMLTTLGLIGHFAAIGAGDSYASRKPDPAHLLATIADAGGDPRTAIMVGDHHNDMLAAQGAAVPSIFAAWGYGADEVGATADAIATEFAALPVLADRLLG